MKIQGQLTIGKLPFFEEGFYALQIILSDNFFITHPVFAFLDQLIRI